jgi:hypothetical protein
MVTSETVGSRRAGDVIAIYVSCVGVAIAYWLLPASVQIVDWTAAGPVRLAQFAPLRTLWLALFSACGAATLLSLMYARFHVARPALPRVLAPLSLLWIWTLPFLPWLPDRAPALLLLAGATRWCVPIAAIFGILIAWPRKNRQVAFPVPGRKGVFALTLALYTFLGLRSYATAGVSGDEPHYLIITHSLLVDRDLKIENNHALGDYLAFFGGELRPDYLQRGRDGAIYSIHSPGLPLLLLPGYAILGARGAVATICLVAALAATAVYEIALLMGGPIAALLTWVAIGFTVPFVPHAWMLYPETAAAAVVASVVLWLIKPLPDRRWIWIVRGAALASLPWLHTKFVVFLLAFVPFIMWRLRHRRTAAAAMLLPVAISCAGWLAFFYVLYGSIDPQVPYGTYTNQFVRFENVPRSLLGLFIDQKFGLLIYGPAYLLAVAGAWSMLRDRVWRSLGLAVVVATVPYLVSSSRLYMWWGGSSAPARFLVPILPLLAAPMAAAFSRMDGRLVRTTAAMFIAFGVAIAAIGVALPDRGFLFSAPHGTARLLEAVAGGGPIAVALPTFTEENWTTPLGRAMPWAVAAGVALAVAGYVTRRARGLTAFWIGAIEALTFAIAGSVLAAPASAAGRSSIVTRGRIELMNTYDPDRLRAWDYRRMTRLDAAHVLLASSLRVDRAVNEPVNGAGRIAGQFVVPPGRYEARVWFFGQHGPEGNLLVTDWRNDVLARVDGPLPNPATIALDLPVPIPFWVTLSERSGASAFRQAELAPISIVPNSRRPKFTARAVDMIQGHPGGFIVYVDGDTYPEEGAFWTRGTRRGDVLVATAGASRIGLTLHLGPVQGRVTINVAGQHLDTDMGANETRRVLVNVPEDSPLVPISIEAPASFRPADVDRRSKDMRSLGCQVRIELE